MTQQNEILRRAQEQSLRKGLAVQATRDGETQTLYFQSQGALDDFVHRAQLQGYTVERSGCAS